MREIQFMDSWIFSGKPRFQKGDTLKINTIKYNENTSFGSRPIGIPNYKQGQKTIVEFVKVYGEPDIQNGRYKIQYFPPFR